MITHQPFSYLCKYTHNFQVSLYLKVKGFRQQLIYCQDDVVFHRQCSGGIKPRTMLSYFIVQTSSLSPLGWSWKYRSKSGEGPIPAELLKNICSAPPTPPFLWGLFPPNLALWYLYFHMHLGPSPPTSKMSIVLAKASTVSWNHMPRMGQHPRMLPPPPSPLVH